jgi:cytochrome oxidase Cu insertion factor (SCO1/SenC/PrrC family)
MPSLLRRLAIAVLVAATLAGCAGGGAGPGAASPGQAAPATTPSTAAPATTTAVPAPSPTRLRPPPELGIVAAPKRKAAPDLSVTAFDGRTITLAGFRGQPVVVNFFESW